MLPGTPRRACHRDAARPWEGICQLSRSRTEQAPPVSTGFPSPRPPNRPDWESYQRPGRMRPRTARSQAPRSGEVGQHKAAAAGGNAGSWAGGTGGSGEPGAVGAEGQRLPALLLWPLPIGPRPASGPAIGCSRRRQSPHRSCRSLPIGQRARPGVATHQ